MFTKWRDVVPNKHMSLEWEIVYVVFVCLFVWPTSCSIALLCFPVPLVDEGWAGVLLGTSFVVPRRQKVALPVYYLRKFVFSHPGQAHLSWMLKRDWPALFFLCVWWWSPTPPRFWYSPACPSTGPIVHCLGFFHQWTSPLWQQFLESHSSVCFWVIFSMGNWEGWSVVARLVVPRALLCQGGLLVGELESSLKRSAR